MFLDKDTSVAIDILASHLEENKGRVGFGQCMCDVFELQLILYDSLGYVA